MCERPGCTGISELSYGIDHDHLVVWIDNRALGEREQAGRLCRRHADALVVPRGWTIDDRRQDVPQLFPVPDSSTSTDDSSTGRVRPRRRPEVVAPLPSLFDGETSDDEVAEGDEVGNVDAEPNSAIEPVLERDSDLSEMVERDAEETKAIPWSPRLHGVDAFPEDEGERPVMGRLLGRAFKRNRDVEGD